MVADQSENDSSFDSDDESLSDADNSKDSSNLDNGEDESKRSNGRTEIYDIVQEDTQTLRSWRVTVIVVLLLSFVGIAASVASLLRSEAKRNEEFVVRTA